MMRITVRGTLRSILITFLKLTPCTRVPCMPITTSPTASFLVLAAAPFVSTLLTTTAFKDFSHPSVIPTPPAPLVSSTIYSPFCWMALLSLRAVLISSLIPARGNWSKVALTNIFLSREWERQSTTKVAFDCFCQTVNFTSISEAWALSSLVATLIFSTPSPEVTSILTVIVRALVPRNVDL